jgi:hypothetical protein
LAPCTNFGRNAFRSEIDFWRRRVVRRVVRREVDAPRPIVLADGGVT